MKLWSDSFQDNARMPERLAFGAPDADNHVRLSDNRNPHLAWSDLPAGTVSLALVCLDPDVPTIRDNVNQSGKSVPADMPRTVFNHWTLWNIAPGTMSIAEGQYSNGITGRGKPGPAAANHTAQGINDFTRWFSNDQDMRGDYYGYDGACPPWNDLRMHRYVFTLYALSVERLDATPGLNGDQVLAMIAPHVIDKISLTGLYTLNPELI